MSFRTHSARRGHDDGAILPLVLVGTFIISMVIMAVATYVTADLRYANADTHAAWNAIVVGGARQQLGMPGHDLSIADSEAIQAFVLSLSESLRSSQ